MAPTFVRTQRTPMKTSRGSAGRAGRKRDSDAKAGDAVRADKPEKAPRPPRPEPTATEQALRLLAFRARTARELDQALAKRKIAPEERAAALARMRELGYIDDVSLAGARARSLIGKGDSPRLVARRLQMQGIAQEPAQAAAQDAAEGASDDELAVRALEKKLRGRPVRDEKDRQRLMRNLVSHGHRPSSVARALKLELNGSESGDTDGDDVG